MSSSIVDGGICIGCSSSESVSSIEEELKKEVEEGESRGFSGVFAAQRNTSVLFFIFLGRQAKFGP